MKAVLISIQPKWCELIANSKKTVEVRKTKPKIETPFKCYIYATKNGDRIVLKNNRVFEISKAITGKVIGEFVCNEIECFTTDYRADDKQNERISKQSCVPMIDLMEYESNAPCLYGWHISNLIIYDEPKELSEFYKYTEYDDSKNDIRPCRFCLHNKYDWSEMCEYCEIDFDGEHCIHLQMRRPPQSWCYVEAL